MCAAFQGLRLANHAVERRLTNWQWRAEAEPNSSGALAQNFVHFIAYAGLRAIPAGVLATRGKVRG